jgi:hypothetical protein
MTISATVSCGSCRTRLRTAFTPANGSSKNPSATGAKGSRENTFSWRAAAWLLLVWMVSDRRCRAARRNHCRREDRGCARRQPGCAQGHGIGVGCTASRRERKGEGRRSTRRYGRCSRAGTSPRGRRKGQTCGHSETGVHSHWGIISTGDLACTQHHRARAR